MILAATGGSDRHALVIEHHLRPLFAFFRAHAVPTGLYATNADFTAEGDLTEAMIGRIAPAVDQLDAWLRVPQARSAAPALGSHEDARPRWPRRRLLPVTQRRGGRCLGWAPSRLPTASPFSSWR